MKNFVERTTPLGMFLRLKREKRARKKFLEWKSKGSNLPVPHYGKQKVLLEYIERFAPKVFVETGTYTGHMVYAMLNKFEKIFSIELDRNLFEKAKRRFKGYDHVHIIYGQSGEILPEILKHTTQPCLFWLDAHWSGDSTAKGEVETPIMLELQCILNHKEAETHVVLIDDARLFTGLNDYPTLKTLEYFILNIHPGWVFEIGDDIIRLHSNSLQKSDII